MFKFHFFRLAKRQPSARLAVLLCLLLGLPLPAFSATQLSQQQSAKLAAGKSQYASNLAKASGMRALSRGRGNFRQGRSSESGGKTEKLIGALQIAEGILGLVAAKKAAQHASRSNLLAQNMGNAPGFAAAPGVDRVQALPGLAEKNTSSRSLSPKEVKEIYTDEVIEALADVEEEYGIPGDIFAQRLIRGEDALEILKKAPTNAAEDAEGRAALAEARAQLVGEAKVVLANQKLAAEEKVREPAESAAKKPAAKTYDKQSLKDRLRSRLGQDLASEEAPQELPVVSAEVQAALAEREEAKLRERFREPSLFEVVHRKYQEKFRVISQPEGIHPQ